MEDRVSPGVRPWLNSLSWKDQEQLLAALKVLEAAGPALGRPLVDTVKGSRHKNMKELRPPSTGRSEMRILFAFDPERTAILLVGGDKSTDWRGWYEANVPVADSRYDQHLQSLYARFGKQHENGRQRRRRGRRQ